MGHPLIKHLMASIFPLLKKKNDMSTIYSLHYFPNIKKVISMLRKNYNEQQFTICCENVMDAILFFKSTY